MTGQSFSKLCPALLGGLHIPVLQFVLPVSFLIDSTLDDVNRSLHMFLFALMSFLVDCTLDNVNRSLHHFCLRLCLAVQVTTSSFDAAFSIDTAGAIYYIITNLSSSSASVQPGSAVLVSGGFGELTPAPTAESDYSSQSVTIAGGDTTIEVDFLTGRRLSGHSDDTASTAGADMGVTPWHSGTSTESSTGAVSGAALPQDWQDSVTHRYVFWSGCVYKRVSAHFLVKVAQATSPVQSR